MMKGQVLGGDGEVVGKGLDAKDEYYVEVIGATLVSTV